MNCRDCGNEKHVCARPCCGHSKSSHDERELHCFASRSRCNCGRYLESPEETACRVEKERCEHWPEEVVAMLERLSGCLHQFHYEQKLLKELIERGKKLINNIHPVR